MHISDSRLDTLQHALRTHKIDVFLLPMVDEFQSEYTPDCAKRLPYLTGFDGSSGLGVFFAQPDVEHWHTLFTDGRYTLQAATQVSARLKVVNSGEVPLTQFLSELKDVRIGFDPWIVTHTQLLRWLEATHGHNVEWVSMAPNPVDAIWTDRPEAPAGEVVLHPITFAGTSYAEKRNFLLDAMSEKGADALILTLPDGINWLLNIRGSDVAFNPLLLAYFMLDTQGNGTLFATKHTFSPFVNSYFAEQGINVKDITEIFDGKSAPLLPKKAKIWLDPSEAAHGLWEWADTNAWTVLEIDDPTLLPKACKNSAELAGIKAAHLRDGLALSKFLCWLDGQVVSKKLPTELDIVEKLESFRAVAPEYRGPSFATIAGSGPNGAIVHYRADASSSRRLRINDLFLLDSGGQYIDGTTDVTRTIAIGTPNDTMCEHFTRVLKGHIALASAQFPAGTNGGQLDILARQHLWAAGLDYDHGTGHGVGAHLSVHEGPQRISKKGGSAALQPGMVVSNEPGYYKAGAYGIRIESLVTVIPASMGEDAPPYLVFETLTLVPIDHRLIDLPLLTADERNWLNAYHRRVYEAHAPHMSPAESVWLTHSTKAI